MSELLSQKSVEPLPAPSPAAPPRRVLLIGGAPRLSVVVTQAGAGAFDGHAREPGLRCRGPSPAQVLRQPKLRPLVDPLHRPLLLATALLLSCARCGAGTRQAPDSATAASAPEDSGSDSGSAAPAQSSKEDPAPAERPLPYCRDLDRTVSFCADDPRVVEEATSSPR